jgi:hypothetical protein
LYGRNADATLDSKDAYDENENRSSQDDPSNADTDPMACTLLGHDHSGESPADGE